MKRAQLFAERFFQDGLIFNGHVKPQSDPWVSVIAGCPWRGAWKPWGEISTKSMENAGFSLENPFF